MKLFLYKDSNFPYVFEYSSKEKFLNDVSQQGNALAFRMKQIECDRELLTHPIDKKVNREICEEISRNEIFVIAQKDFKSDVNETTLNLSDFIEYKHFSIGTVHTEDEHQEIKKLVEAWQRG